MKIDPRQIRVGTAIEMEHTNNPAMARKIAMDHLAEDSAYYTKLCAWHKDKACRKLKRRPRRAGPKGARTPQQKKFQSCTRECKGGSGYRSCMRSCLRR